MEEGRRRAIPTTIDPPSSMNYPTISFTNLESETFDLPEGCYLARLANAYFRDLDKGKTVRLVFFVEIPENPSSSATMAGKDFVLEDDGSLRFLRQFLVNWLGEGTIDSLGDPSDLSKLVGTAGEIVLRHKSRPGHLKPFVRIEGMFPEGSKQLTTADDIREWLNAS